VTPWCASTAATAAAVVISTGTGQLHGSRDDGSTEVNILVLTFHGPTLTVDIYIGLLLVVITAIP